MLNLVYYNSIDSLSESGPTLSCAQKSLLEKIQSKSRFDQLMAVLPEDWEEKYIIRFFNNPKDINHSFRKVNIYKGSLTKKESIICSIIVSDGHDATPGTFEEYLKRDYDYPIEEDQWKIDSYLTEYNNPSFHVDHRLIWTTKEREIDFDSNDPIENVPYTYVINVYIPDPQVLINVENIKLASIQ